MRKVYTQAERDSVEQPVSKDGYSNDRFDSLYGKDKNPYLGSERDRSRKNWRMNAMSNVDQKKYEEGWERIFGKKNGYNKGTIEKS